MEKPYFLMGDASNPVNLWQWNSGTSDKPESAALINATGYGKFEAREGYRSLLERVFGRAVHLLAEDATIYVRTDSREFTYRTTLAVLRKVFPDKRLVEVRRPMLRPSQTRLFGEWSTAVETDGEVDLILRPR